jgi:peptidoglycan/LPS O-acetylase OafA/YrhL
MAEVDPVGAFTLRITPETRVATAGSCFAQHIARHLQQAGFHYFVAEDAHPILPHAVRKAHHYGVFSARYGNIYTARQLRQLMERAYGRLVPAEPAWIEADGSVLDPFRPSVQPGGFVSAEEMEADRQQHLACVRRMFETCEVFVFTLGLTECWVSKEDGAAFPLCPGVEGGQFDPDRYAFHNQTVDEVTADMAAFIERLQEVNPAAQVVLTVSPVPLMATAEPGAHVLEATTYSKSVLRVAAETLRQRYAHVHYFPSYEIITGAHSRGRYLADDLRTVREEGVAHVMRLFLKHAAGVGENLTAGKTAAAAAVCEADQATAHASAIVTLECDEEALDREMPPAAEMPPAMPLPPPAAGGSSGGFLRKAVQRGKALLARTRAGSASLDRRIDGLDELRGLSVLSLMFFHGTALFTWLPVNFDIYALHCVVLFFMISGYLITKILIRQVETGEPLAHFFIRRALRIWPLMIAALVTGAVLMPEYASSIAFNVLLVNNYSMAMGIGPVFRTDVMWSLAIEEQFYLVWPFVVMCLGRRLLPFALFGLILTGFLFDAGILQSPWPMPVFKTAYGCMQYIALGAAIALGRAGLIAALGAIAAFLLVFAASTGSAFFAGFRPVWWGVTFALFALVWVTVHHRPLIRSAFLAFAGRLCYGLYIIHFFISWLVLEHLGSGVVLPGALYAAASFALAIASFHLLEKPALSLRTRLEASPRLQGLLLTMVFATALLSLISILSRLPLG